MAAVVLAGFGAFTQHLVSRGYAVAAPNVRGSSGYGKRFQSLDDVEQRLDSVPISPRSTPWLAARPEIDGDRQVVYGRSYGGYMVLAALAFQPELWAAGLEMRRHLEPPSRSSRTRRSTGAPRASASTARSPTPTSSTSLSPWSRLDAIRAPLFIEHGRNDPRVPVSESEAIHGVLAEKGVRCELVIYEDEGHTIDKLPNRIDCFERMVAFLDETSRLEVSPPEEEAEREDSSEQDPRTERDALEAEDRRSCAHRYRPLCGSCGADAAQVVLVEDLAVGLARELLEHAAALRVGVVARVDASSHVDALVRRGDVHKERRDRQLLGDEGAVAGGQRIRLSVGEDDEEFDVLTPIGNRLYSGIGRSAYSARSRARGRAGSAAAC